MEHVYLKFKDFIGNGYNSKSGELDFLKISSRNGFKVSRIENF